MDANKLKKKFKSDGSTKNFKVRLVAESFYQREGIDYMKTYSLVVKFASIRIILVIIIFYNLDIWQMDVKKKFKWRTKGNNFYPQHEGYIDKNSKNKVYILKKSL